ncbi:MAG: hypothetical protein SGI74_13655 [Oligoflexia bacterium]|nr:hypothetical protein [Oligoflexia bacterium]
MFKQFNFKNFKPSSELAIKANLALFESVDSVPYGSLKEAVMIKLKNKYHCFIEVKSKESPFIVKSISSNPYMALSRLSLKIKDKVVRWQTKRFVEPLLSLVQTQDYAVQKV